MTTIPVQGSEAERGAGNESRILEPLRRVQDLMRGDPFHDLFKWGGLSQVAPSWLGGKGEFTPAFDVKESRDCITFKADVPGVKETDLEVRLSQNRLMISGKRESEKTDKGDAFYTYERAYGSFVRTLRSQRASTRIVSTPSSRKESS